MVKQFQTFLINVVILEGRHYVWPNMDSMVMVKVDNQKKCTAVKFFTDSPYYNEHFVFEFFTSLENIIDKNITITVIKPGSIVRKRKVLGYVTLDVGTIWYQTNHQFYHKWAILTAPREEYVGGTRGYLKLDVCVLSKGEAPKIPRNINSDEIEGNLLLPFGHTSDRQRIHFVIDIYKGIDFIKKNPLHESYVKKLEIPSSLLIEISFSGSKVKTTVKKNTATPNWYERLILPELFPPLCQRFKIELYHGENSKRSIRYLNLRDIADDKEEGFLPTFGPAFLHFYSQNPLEGYLGKVLMALETKLVGNTAEINLQPQEAPIINEEMLLNYESVTLFAAIFEVSSISNKYSDKSISFRMACGIHFKETDESGDKFLSFCTAPIKPVITNKNYCYLPIEGSKPCLDLTLFLPDTRKKMYNYNLLNKILVELKHRLDKIEEVFNRYDYSIACVKTETLLPETIDFISSAAGKYIDIVSSYNLEEESILDQQRQKMCLKEIEKIIVMSKSISLHTNKKKVFQKLEKLYTKFESLIDQIEDWPHVYLWMIYGNKRVAYYIIKPENIVHSLVEEEKGIHCGTLQTIYFQTEEKDISEFISMVCHMRAIFWMGLSRHWNECIQNLPAGFDLSLKTVPKVLVAEEKHEFQCRAHIFQGRFCPGSDKTGLCDPFAHVIIGGQYRQTQVLKKILNPVWDQTLIFNKIILYGEKKFIVDNPPSVFIEIYDKDELWKFELVGKCAVKPIVKMAESNYVTPKLSSHPIYNNMNAKAEILVAVELIEMETDDVAEKEPRVLRIPQEIKPNLVSHRIDVVFWGLRHLKKVLNRPKIVIECANSCVQSDTLAKKCLNFTNPIKALNVILPEQEEYAPALSIKLYDCRNFGTTVFAGVHVLSTEMFFYKPLFAKEREKKIIEGKSRASRSLFTSVSTFLQTFEETKKPEGDTKKKTGRFQFFKRESEEKLSKFFDETNDDYNDFNWWTKFYASLKDLSPEEKSLPCNRYRLKVYSNELELQPEFEGFTDILHSFPLYKGKRTGDETVDEENTVAVLKGSLGIYPWPPSGDQVTAAGLSLDRGVFQDYPSNSPVRFVLRVYCVRGLNLRAKDITGKSDPYLHLTLNEQVISDRLNYVMGQVNPMFGRCFELCGVFPQDHMLVVAIYDWDAATADDLIGQTKIDLENRFYTRHRAHCGLAEDYLTSGYCLWRDQQRPTAILESLCSRHNLPEPEYAATSVRIGSMEFEPKNFNVSDNIEFDRQVQALAVLRRWQEVPVVGCVLVPEHVETRSLYHPNKPGIEQGKLQLWIDILPCTDLPTPRPVNIVPQKPVAYELRVIVWNAENMKMDEDDFFTGEKKSDIFIKGWLTGPENSQYTDVHYRSLSGEANFNWRFIFPFEYLSNENKIVLKEKSMFGLEPIESKIPCRLTMQAWDNDTFSKHDFLGVLNLDISRMHRGARTAKTCNLSLLQTNTPVLNLFKVRRTRGWWPMKNVDLKNQQDYFAGALELEFELLTKEDAEKFPAGLGRAEPQGLPKPRRPDTSFSWFWNPLKAFKYVLKSNKWKFFKLGLLLVLIIFIFVGIYALPSYSVKKLLGV